LEEGYLPRTFSADRKEMRSLRKFLSIQRKSSAFLKRTHLPSFT